MVGLGLRARTLALSALVSIVIGCGGGGGGGGGSPSPPPPNSNAPVARAAAASSTVEEGQTVDLTAADSTNPLSGTLTYSWTQVAGPTATLEAAIGPNVRVVAPEVSANQTARFRVTVTNSVASSTAEVTLTFANILQTPVFKALTLVGSLTTNGTITDLYGSPSLALVGVRPGQPSDPITFVSLTQSGGGLQIGSTPALNSPLPSGTRLAAARLLGLPEEVSAINASGNQVTLYGDFFSSPPVLQQAATVNVTSPCATAGEVSNVAGQFVIGRGGGLSLHQGTQTGPASFSVSEQQAIITSSNIEYCAVGALRSPITGGPFKTSRLALWDLISVDTVGNTIDVYTEVSTPNGFRYQLAQSTPVQLNYSGPQPQAPRFIGYAPVATMFGTSGYALLYSNQKLNGEHRMVIVGLNADRTLSQTTVSWPKGSPVAAFRQNLDGDGAMEIAVLTRDSPQAVVFESPNGQSLLPLSSPSYMEVGLGATTGLSARNGALGLNAMLVGYSSEVKAFQ